MVWAYDATDRWQFFFVVGKFVSLSGYTLILRAVEVAREMQCLLERVELLRPLYGFVSSYSPGETHMSHGTWHMAHVTCHMSHVTCHIGPMPKP